MSPRGRHRSGHGDPLNGNAITDCVAVAESFAVSRLLVLCPAIPERDVFSRKSRLTAWRGHGVVDLNSYGRWSALMGYAEVRNAMLHGLGRLTDEQLGKRRQQVLVQIKAAGVHLNGPTVMLVEGTRRPTLMPAPVSCASWTLRRRSPERQQDPI